MRQWCVEKLQQHFHKGNISEKQKSNDLAQSSRVCVCVRACKCVWGHCICVTRWNPLSIKSADTPNVEPKMRGNWKCAPEDEMHADGKWRQDSTVGSVHATVEMTKEAPRDSLCTTWVIHPPRPTPHIQYSTIRYQMAPTAIFALNTSGGKEQKSHQSDPQNCLHHDHLNHHYCAIIAYQRQLMILGIFLFILKQASLDSSSLPNLIPRIDFFIYRQITFFFFLKKPYSAFVFLFTSGCDREWEMLLWQRRQTIPVSRLSSLLCTFPDVCWRKENYRISTHVLFTLFKLRFFFSPCNLNNWQSFHLLLKPSFI